MSFIPLALAAAAGFLGYKVLVDKKEGAANPSLGQATQLEPGKAYTVMHATNEQLPRIAAQSNVGPEDVIRAMMASNGFEVMSKPVLKDAQNVAAYMQGKPAAWVYNVRWMRAEPYVEGTPPVWSGMMQFYKLPTT